MPVLKLQYSEVLPKKELLEKLKNDLPQYLVRNGMGKVFQVRKGKLTFCSVGVNVDQKKNQIVVSSMQDNGILIWFLITGILAFFVCSKKRKAYTENMKEDIKTFLDQYHNDK